MPRGIPKLGVRGAAAPKEEPYKPRPRETYNIERRFPDWAAQASQLQLDRFAFAWRVPISDGAPMRPELFRRIADVLNPTYFEWHDWTNRLVRAVCGNRWVGLTGCSNSAKTHNMAGFAALWWLCDPMESSVIFCSTTAKALRKRGWSNIQAFYSGIPGPRIGNFVDSRMLWQITQGDDKHAIMGIAVEEGSTTKVADNIKGVHTKRQLVVIDEGTSVPPAIKEACTNLYAYPQDSGGEFIMVMMGNARSRLDEFGKFIEPIGGWGSVTVDDEEWETVPQIDGSTGICIRFDVEKSPNVINPLPDGKLISVHLPTKQRVESYKRRPGFDQSPNYWSNERGMPPPDGVTKTIFSEAALSANDAYGRHQFTGNNFIILGVLDPARADGDRPALRFGAMGEIEQGGIGIELMEPIEIFLDARSSNPVDYQLLESVKLRCEKVMYRGQEISCSPRNFGLDATGGGADLADIMQRTWSPHIIRVGFGESPSSDPVSHEDIRPANEVYRNRRAEMFFRARHASDTQQLKGLDRETAKELCSLDYDDSKPLIVLTSKKDYKKKFGKSPDFADTVAIMVEVARRKGFKLAVQGTTVKRTEDFSRLVRASEVVEETSHYEPEEPMEDDFEPEFS